MAWAQVRSFRDMSVPASVLTGFTQTSLGDVDVGSRRDFVFSCFIGGTWPKTETQGTFFTFKTASEHL